MDRNTMERYEKILRNILDELRSEASQAVGECKPVIVDGSIGRVSRGDALQVQQLALEMKRRREARILRLESALKRIRLGAYGFCVGCQCPIEHARLHTLPDVVLCVDCASDPKRESNDRKLHCVVTMTPCPICSSDTCLTRLVVPEGQGFSVLRHVHAHIRREATPSCRKRRRAPLKDA